MNLIADTCFWISLCDPKESNHEEILNMMDKLLNDSQMHILVPHPVLYESLCSRMVRKPEQVQRLTYYFNKTIKIPDQEYVNNAFQKIISQAENMKGEASMVDIVIMLMAEDPRYQVKGILTNNGRDFSQFCQRLKIPMLESFASLSIY